MAVKKILHKSPAHKEEPVSVTNSSQDNNSYSELQKALLKKDYSSAVLENIEGTHKNVSNGSSGTGCITIINHKKCGKRLHLSNAIWRGIGCPEFVKLSFYDGDLIVSPGKQNDIIVRFDRKVDEDDIPDYKGKVILYAAKSSDRLVKEWHLDKDSKCSFTVGEFVITEINGFKAAVIANPNDAEPDDESEIAESDDDVSEELDDTNDEEVSEDDIDEDIVEEADESEED